VDFQNLGVKCRQEWRGYIIQKYVMGVLIILHISLSAVSGIGVLRVETLNAARPYQQGKFLLK